MPSHKKIQDSLINHVKDEGFKEGFHNVQRLPRPPSLSEQLEAVAKAREMKKVTKKQSQEDLGERKQVQNSPLG